MVEAGCPAYCDSTLAARPVGASSTDGISSAAKPATTAAMAVVLPVPAYPFTTRISPSSEDKNAETARSSRSWQGVGEYGNAFRKNG